jgi:hypothetical protein
MGFKQSAGDALVHSSTVSALKVQVRKTKAQQCAHHGVGPFVPEEATLGVAPNLPSGPVGRLEDRHVHAGLPQPVRSREPTVQRQNAISSNTSQAPHTEAHTLTHKTKNRASRVADADHTHRYWETHRGSAHSHLTPAPTTATDLAGAGRLSSEPAMASTGPRRRLVWLARADAGR